LDRGYFGSYTKQGTARKYKKCFKEMRSDTGGLETRVTWVGSDAFLSLGFLMFAGRLLPGAAGFPSVIWAPSSEGLSSDGLAPLFAASVCIKYVVATKLCIFSIRTIWTIRTNAEGSGAMGVEYRATIGPINITS
jgi:hypothetical protein